MMKTVLKTTFMTLALALLAIPATAGSRYGSPPPLTLSPDLASPWTLQLQPRSGVAPRVRRAKPRRRKQQVNINRHRKPTAEESRSGVQVRKKKRQQAPKGSIDPELLPTLVDYQTDKKPGTLVINTIERRLYLVMPNGKARRYGVGVGKPGFEWAGVHKVSRKTEWPDWRPPAEMIEREAKKGRILPPYVAGGPKNPLGARALYLGSTLYRIHGSNQPWSIGRAVSSGCIRMRNEDVMDLYDRVKLGTKVYVI